MNKELLADKLKVKDAKLFIDGKYVDSVCGETFDTFNPATNRKLASIAKANEEMDTKRAIDVAERTFKSGIWSKNACGRAGSNILCKMSDLIMERVDELAYIETLDVGKPIKESKDSIYHVRLIIFASLLKWLNI